MENKKLLKFLYKDIAEIEELFTEKGSEGFDEYEIEFIQSRFKGAKQIIQIFSEKENKRIKSIQSQFHSQTAEENSESVESHPLVGNEQTKSEQPLLSAEEQESLNSLSEFEEELNDSKQALLEEEAIVEEEQVDSIIDAEKSEALESKSQGILNESEVVHQQPETAAEEHESRSEETEPNDQDSKLEVDLNDEPELDEANHRLGDRFLKEKSVNELLAGDGNKLEHKISNSRVASIKAAIGINDRYQYIRELFDGNADTFSKTVSELDSLTSIKEAVTYLQQNYKWKKNETSLKFVNLVKRRFPNE